ncbi:hypothetical protein CHS0354_011739 [Potamilus streckersoni]|uniref:SBF1/SBF2 domain-containing protein n=1 Tax=Potamilus streckersoni TaxID=2493646 RepID=A0AAE0W3W7_9BIVA|nr:hypothetical protein CHS0354_011739 [Potamilus streckersoni]
MEFLNRRRSETGIEDQRSQLSSSFSEGTSRFFSSMIAKKNGLLNDLSSKFESVGASLMKSSPSSSSNSSSYSSGEEDHKTSKQSSLQCSADLTGIKTRKEQDSVAANLPSHSRVSGHLQKHQSSSDYSDNNTSEDSHLLTGVNISFDEPLYSPSKISHLSTSATMDKSLPTVTSLLAQKEITLSDLSKTPSVSQGSNKSEEAVTMADPGQQIGVDIVSSTDRRAPKFTVAKRRSSTVDEMLFDDYIEPEAEPEPVYADEAVTKKKTLLHMGDLISFDEPELEDFHPRTLDSKEKISLPSVSSLDSSEVDFGTSSYNQTSVDSSEVEFGGIPFHRTGSHGSEKSWSSSFSTDSQPDDLTLNCMSFMKQFVEKIFTNGEEISQTEKAQFGQLCQQAPGRLWFARYVNSQRVRTRKVEESIFFRLVQYFAIVLFECNEAEDFSPAKSLMNMCFTFYHENQHGKMRYKTFLYSCLKEQSIWQSLRFWNAAFFDAVQTERARQPVCTSEDGQETQYDDNRFQENIMFGQLGTFTCNMRAFGLGKDLCLEFLRKQSTIASLKEEQVQMLRDNVEKSKDH